MKKIIVTLVIAIVAMTGLTQSANAELRFGLKAGVAVNSFHFDSSTFSSNNRAGFTGGAMMEFTLPATGLGFDLAAMYVRRNNEWLDNNNISHDNRSYIELPLNLKWRINIPVVNNIIRPYLFTGPAFSFLTSKKSVSNAFRNRSFDASWNFGFGVELVKHVQVGASYGIGMTKAFNTGGSGINGRNNYWTITAAYLF